MPDDIKQAIKEAVKALQDATQTKKGGNNESKPSTPNQTPPSQTTNQKQG